MSSAKHLSNALDNNDKAARPEKSITELPIDQMKAEETMRKTKPRPQTSFELIRSQDYFRFDPILAESEHDEALYKQIVENGPSRKLHAPRQRVLKALKVLLVKFPNFREVTTEIIGRYKLSLIGGSAFSLPVINLQGPPGIGKTTYVRAVAEALGQPFHDLKVSQMMERFELAGMSKGWKNAKPGKIARILLIEESEDGQPVILFDELCMAKDTEDNSVIHPLYTLFDRDSGEYFRDLFLDMPINTSYVLAFCATNNIEALRPALRSRLSSFNIEAPTKQEMRELAQNLYRQLLEKFNVVEHFPDPLSSQVLQELTEGSIRDMKLKLERAIIRSVGESHGRESFKLSREHVPEAQPQKRTIGFV
ncbi:AAA family ATPase [Marinobacter orientalis]|uniref:AAA family ATPase n=1 Tax=Marinobacter orientalis TaxID=1928859 RepID=A0A7Y0WRY8_9GAMM|nr:AAA family ATPase [Marinobacter orientalis]NMT63473.1 AAA family ATPase [Marinobacter orientalis]TGX48534.1 AAA family ATPase [Marinobacter orientalis]